MSPCALHSLRLTFIISGFPSGFRTCICWDAVNLGLTVRGRAELCTKFMGRLLGPAFGGRELSASEVPKVPQNSAYSSREA